MVKRLLILSLVLCAASIACARSISPPADRLSPGTITSPSVTTAFITTPTHTLAPTLTPIPAVRIELGERALFYGDWEEALREYQTIYTNSDDAEMQAAALLGMGKARWMERNYYEAIRVLEKLIQQFSESTSTPHAYFFLGRAHEALEQYELAAQAYQKYQDFRPGLIDSYVLDLSGDALFNSGDYASAAKAYQSALLAPSQLDEIQLGLKLARAYALSGDNLTALTVYDDLSMRAKDANTLALIQLRKAQAYEAMGQTEQAIAAYSEAVNNYPTSYNAYLALIALVEAGVAVDELQRGIIDYYAAQYGVALAALDRYLQSNPTDPASAYYFYGLTTRALGGHRDAVAYWDKVIQGYPDHPYWDEAWEQKAYTLWAYLGDFEAAIQTLQAFIEKRPDHPRAGEFLYDAADVSERAGKLDQAAKLWERVANLYPGYELSWRALFLAGITQFRLKDYRSAQATFQRALTNADNLSNRSAAYFWIAKSQYAQGEEAAARASWELVTNIDPTGYYSERARDILRDRSPFEATDEYNIAFDAEMERIKAEQWLRTTFGLSAELDLSGLGPLAADPRIARAEELWRLGLFDDAYAEIEQVRFSVQSDAAQSYRLANHLIALGIYRPGILCARQVLNLAQMDDAETMNAPAYFNHLRFGTYYKDLIIPLAKTYGFHPLFLFSLVRQESLFDGYVSSSAGARGLMQIIPSTGQTIAENMGWPPNYSADDLFRPIVSLTLGVEYLDKQRKAFDGNLYAALAAYNSGPGNALQWYRSAPDDPDLFLEIIRYYETRNYIRGVYELYNIYRRLYTHAP